MDSTLLGAGLACLVAAIVGGGMKAFGFEIPLVSSTKRQLMLGLLGLTLAVASINAVREVAVSSFKGAQDDSGKRHTPTPTLTTGTWTLRNAIDRDGNDWSDSTLKFTTQASTATGLTLEGVFAWRLRGTRVGTEEFRGQYVSNNRQVIFEGVAIKDDPGSQVNRLAVGSYSVVVAPDERTLLEGRWGSTMSNEAGSPGSWEAFR